MIVYFTVMAIIQPLSRVLGTVITKLDVLEAVEYEKIDSDEIPRILRGIVYIKDVTNEVIDQASKIGADIQWNDKKQTYQLEILLEFDEPAYRSHFGYWFRHFKELYNVTATRQGSIIIVDFDLPGQPVSVCERALTTVIVPVQTSQGTEYKQEQVYLSDLQFHRFVKATPNAVRFENIIAL